MPAFTLSEFRSNLKEVARSNRFLVTITQESFAGDKTLSYTAKSASLPDKALTEIEHKRFGATRKIAGDLSHSDLTIVFLSDAELKLRSALEAWIDKINDLATNKKAILKDYVNNTFITVQQMNGKNVAVKTYTFSNVWIKSIEATELSTDSNDAPSEISATFTYDWWEVS